MSSACGKVDERLRKAAVDRAQRRQNRLDTKIFGLQSGGKSRTKKRARSSDLETVEQRASKCADCGSYEEELTKGPRPLCNSCRQKWKNKRKERVARNLQDVSSDGDSVEIISACSEPGEKMYVKDLEAKLQQCKAELREVRAHQQRLETDLTEAEKKIITSEEKNVKLETNVYYLSLIKKEHEILRVEKKSWEILQAELRMQLEAKEAEVTCVNEKYNCSQEEIQRLKNIIKSINSLSDKVVDNKPVQDPSIPNLGSLSGRSGVVTGQQEPAAEHEGSKKASNGIKTEHAQVVAEDSDCEVDVDVDTEPDHPILTTSRNPAGPGHITSRNPPTQFLNRGSAGVSGGGGYDAEAGGGLEDGGYREESEEGGMCGSPQGEDSDTDAQDLIPLIVHEGAQRYVDQDFIYWMNTSLRRPTPQEMRDHKTNYPQNKKPYYWVGICGSDIINAYVEACSSPPRRIPKVYDLVAVFRLVPDFKFDRLTSHRPGVHDFYWYLVWKHCLKIPDYPGYRDNLACTENLPRKRGRPRKVSEYQSVPVPWTD
ncbi:hypothetical protein R1sor_019805 [Riccia sorocarpa]|uniref:Uncharacterized protein n=1 Tax=Riccia sorocarpa TaxID=122646 RepID=A0ABD3IDJ7_9MARC